MAETKIQWADHSVNPIRARHKETGKVGHYCEKIAAGCTRCYSSAMQRRFGTPAFGSGQHRDEYEIFLDESKLEEVERRRKPTRYFWEDMSDFFGDWMQSAWLDKCFATMDQTPQHTHMLLTKRPENIRRMWPEDHWDHGPGWLHRDNVWLGVSCSDQQTADQAIPELLKCRELASVLFVSYEPALGPVDFRCLQHHGEVEIDCLRGTHGVIRPHRGESSAKLDWLIIGGESGPNARPCNIEWIRSAVEQCREAGVACFCKQLGSKPVEQPRDSTGRHSIDRPIRYDGIRDPKGGDPDEWPEDIRVRQFPKVGKGGVVA